MGAVTRREILPYVFLTHLETQKFKTGTVQINLLTQLTRETAAKNAILPRILLRGTARYPDLRALRQAMDDLYGANIEPTIRKKGEIQCVGFCASFVDDACLPEGEGILAQITALLGEILLDPSTQNGQFQADYVDQERENLLDEIRGRINNKGSYAVSRLVELMCDGEDFSTFRLGTEQEAADIDTETLTTHYKSLLSAAPVEIFYCGSATVDQLEQVLTAALKTLPRGEPDYAMGTQIRLNALEATPRYFTEELDVTQGKLSLGFRLGDCLDNPNWAAISLFHYLYGGSVNSKLFLNVRERLSLCYYASSILEKAKGLLLVASGVAFDKYEEAKSEILAQLRAIAEGEITDEELLWAKKALMTDLELTRDEPRQLEEFYLQQTILEVDYDLDDLIAMVEQVDVKEVMKIAQGVELDAVYFLKGEEEVS
ncbi:MAG: insulinase family protein [Oscillospiraceae bacterium]|nr:insulinase family protein [Oscillospiraceae bacterium]